ncbi:MAG: AIM24 family protein [Planctomycetota bacterium]
MAKFRIGELEGTRFVEVHMDHEMVRAEAGALSYLKGEIEVHSSLFTSPGQYVRSVIAQEAVYRPTYFGTGVLTLESSLGGYHVLELGGESWILERGAYWASEGSVELSFKRERFITSLFAGEGPIYLQTRVRGHGKVVLTTTGPVETIELDEGQRVAVDGKTVIARTGSVRFKVRQTTKNFLGRFTAGEGRVRVYEGPGRVLLTPTHFWRYKMMSDRQGNDPALMS